MNDLDLFAIGCGITFIALAGTYAYLRERFLEGTRRPAEGSAPKDLVPARQAAHRRH